MDRTSLVTLPASLAHPGDRIDARYVMGIDGGATKTLAAVLDLKHGAVHLGHGGPSNQDAVGARAAVGALLGAADEAIGQAGIGQEDLGATVLAVASTNTDTIAAHIRTARSESWTVVNDVVGAWATATGSGPGVAAISGTGSNVFGVGPDGRTWRSGGWGHVLGDEASGYWLGVESIRAALHDRDASGPPTALSDAVPAFFGLASIDEVVTAVYSKPLTKGEIAALAVETQKLADEGDAVALSLYERAAHELAEQIAAVVRQTGLTGEFPVGLVGSGFKAGAVFVEPIRRVIAEIAPRADVQTVHVAPVAGSLVLAVRACGLSGEISVQEISGVLEHDRAARQT